MSFPTNLKVNKRLVATIICNVVVVSLLYVQFYNVDAKFRRHRIRTIPYLRKKVMHILNCYTGSRPQTCLNFILRFFWSWASPLLKI